MVKCISPLSRGVMMARWFFLTSKGLSAPGSFMRLIFVCRMFFSGVFMCNVMGGMEQS